MVPAAPHTSEPTMTPSASSRTTDAGEAAERTPAGCLPNTARATTPVRFADSPPPVFWNTADELPAVPSLANLAVRSPGRSASEDAHRKPARPVLSSLDHSEARLYNLTPAFGQHPFDSAVAWSPAGAGEGSRARAQPGVDTAGFLDGYLADRDEGRAGTAAGSPLVTEHGRDRGVLSPSASVASAVAASRSGEEGRNACSFCGQPCSNRSGCGDGAGRFYCDGCSGDDRAAADRVLLTPSSTSDAVRSGSGRGSEVRRLFDNLLDSLDEDDTIGRRSGPRSRGCTSDSSI